MSPGPLLVFFLLVTSFSSFCQQNKSKPEIIGQTPSPLHAIAGSPITIELSNLIVTDEDPTPVYPEGYTLEITGGKDYKVQGTTVTPDADFEGMLSVSVRVDDGQRKSDKFDLQISVTGAQNSPPQIIGQQPLSINQGESITIALSHLTVTDPDNSYPTGFTLKLYGGNNYTINGTTVTPSANFSGTLSVPVTVNDGENESEGYNLQIEVIKPENKPPTITGQQPLSINQGESITIALNHLTVTDPDNTYPTGFTLKLFGGNNYTFNGATVTPSANFFGTLSVPVTVNDGENESERFDLQIAVIKPENKPPTIIGQQPLSINQGESTTIALNHLIVTDPDNTYPTGFTLKLSGGNNYTINGTTVTPSANFSGTLSVPVTVNDGENESERFDLQIAVIKPENKPPTITGQQPLSINQGESITIGLSHLIVTDPDNTYPTGFTLKLFGGNNYTFNGTTVTPAANFSGTLSVPVTVNDGENESERNDLQITVIRPENKPPTITGQQPISINQGESITIALTHLTVTDPDNTYPTGFTLKLFGGNNYTFNGATVTPSANFSGTLSVPVTVNDGENESGRYDLKIEVIKPENKPPTITGQHPLSINQGESITIALSHLIVTDPDNTYPTGFTLTLYGGNNYTLNGTTVTPSANFSGTLSVPVTVNDGENESGRYDLKIEVVKPENKPPTITGQQPLSINQGESITIALSHLTVTDPDNSYPTGFTLTLYGGNNYTINGTTVTPSANFSGTLSVPVTVNDGENESGRYDLKIAVIKPENKPPTITGHQPLSINQGESITIALSHLIVTDPDNTYPTGFTLKLSGGNNYTINGTTVTPSANFSGTLSVPVTVNDGENESERFDLQIAVIKPENKPPTITGQQPLSINQGESITIALSHLTVTDPDNSYPTGFTLKLSGGNNYTINGTTVTPSANFSGTLSVPVTVNDGENESEGYNLQIEVIKPENKPPTITSQQPLNISQGESITIALNHLTVTDPDNTYPTGFTLKLFGGNNYTFNGATVTPSANFFGTLSVPVTVNDGENESARYNLKIDVIKPENKPPTITGQQALSVNQGESITIALNHLTVTDPDNTYPTGFTLKLYGGSNYTFNGTKVTPSANFSGTLSVPVTVNDGENESGRYNLKIDVIKPENRAPTITGQQPMKINQGESLTVELSHLIVTDPDNTYPTGFTLKVFPGNNFSLSQNTITTSPNFIGTLTVSVSVSDGQNESKIFFLKIEVIQVQNVAPQITGQQSFQINEDETITLQLSNLKVKDPDNVYPNGFSLKIGEGDNYKVSGTIISPNKNYFGELTVPVTVNDGLNESSPFNLKITVAPVNDAPEISAQVPLSTNKNTLITLNFSDLTVIDTDNEYPEGFTLKILPGANYSSVSNLVSPAPDFTGLLNVTIMVNDGQANSPEFNLKIQVLSPTVNTPPTITGQKLIRIAENTSIMLQLSHLVVTDPDNDFPIGFTLKVLPSSSYTVDGTNVTPSATIVNGVFFVAVTVNDGHDDSAPFEVKIEVVPPTARPQITGQKELTMMEDSTLTIDLTDLIVSDADDPDYPRGFILVVLPNDGLYTRDGNSITPTPNLNGFIEVDIIVSDGANVSEQFKVAILVMPVNDPPQFVEPDTTVLAYEPGHDPYPIFETINIFDVDDDHLILAEIGFEPENYSPTNDQCIFPIDHSNIRSVYDSSGRLFLIGYATIDDYLEALRSIQYNYVVTRDFNGDPAQILAGPRKVYVTAFDSHLGSATHRRTISMEIEIGLDIPNTFTPNGDQQNDTWHINILNAAQVDDARIRVYDRRGALLYDVIGFENEWDGSVNGQTLPLDTYFYTIDLNLSYMKRTYKGAVTIFH